MQELGKTDLADVVESETLEFEAVAARYQRGNLTQDEFRVLRLPYGVYGQKSPGLFTLMVRSGAGGLNAGQLRTFGELAEEFADGRVHLTTRQTCQLGSVALPSIPGIMRRLATVGLTSREACGNVVQNVTACYLAGSCPRAVFDVESPALELSAALLRQPEFQELPRKFKIAFSGCDHDCALAAVHDLGLIACERGHGGKPERGYRVVVGGGLGALPSAAGILADFVPESSVEETIKAVLRVFNRHGQRGNRMLARLKFMVRDLGMARIRELVAGELPEGVRLEAGAGEGPQRGRDPRALMAAPEPVPELTRQARNWWKQNVRQRPQGDVLIWVCVMGGMVQSFQMLGLADLLEGHAGTAVRLTPEQNLVLTGFSEQDLPEVWQRLELLELGRAAADHLSDITTCPGSPDCSIGVTRSLTLTEVLGWELAGYTHPEVAAIKVRVGGCPNSCAHHHLADIGLVGNARKVGGTCIPCYMILLGGGLRDGAAQFARPVAWVPARQVPDAIHLLIHHYLRSRRNGESFAGLVARLPLEEFRDLIKPLTEVDGTDENRLYDWGDTRPFQLKVGRSESGR